MTDIDIPGELIRLTDQLETAYKVERHAHIRLLRIHTATIAASIVIMILMAAAEPRVYYALPLLVLSNVVWGLHMRAVLKDRRRGSRV